MPVALKSSIGNPAGDNKKQRFVTLQKRLIHTNVLVGELARINVGIAFAPPCFPQIRAVERAIDRILALSPATDGTDMSGDTRAVPARTSRVTNRAGSLRFGHADIISVAVIMVGNGADGSLHQGHSGSRRG